jgi:hypothetical protein
MFYIMSRDSSVIIASGYGIDCRGSVPLRGKVFIFSTASRPVLGPTQPPILWAQAALSPGVKWPDREADHSPPSNAEVKNGKAMPSLPNSSSWHSV